MATLNLRFVTSDLLMAPKIFVNELEVGLHVQSVFFAEEVDVRRTRDDHPYLAVTLKDRTGAIDARAFDDVETLATRIASGQFVALRGEVQEFAQKPYLHIHDLEPIDADLVTLSDFFEHSRWSAEAMFEQLVGLIESRVESPQIRALLCAYFNDDALKSRFVRAPAATRNHHAYHSGLLEHCLSMARLALQICDHYDAYYPRLVNSDLVVAGCVLHDIGKCVELEFEGSTRYTDEGKLVGHIAIGTAWIDAYADQAQLEIPQTLRRELKHLVLSHHGKLEYASPVTPKTVEAMLLHQIDMIDSRINTCWRLFEGESQMVTEVWSDYDPALEGRLYFRGPASWATASDYDPDDLTGPGVTWDGARRKESEPQPKHQNLDLFGE